MPSHAWNITPGRAVLRGACAALCALVAVLAMASPASAAARMEVGMEDPRLLQSEPDRAQSVVEAWKALGVETVRLHARWYATSPASRRIRRPRNFDLSDPSERRYDWSSLDYAVALVLSAGMTPMVTVTGPAPYWATEKPRLRKGQWLPRPDLFGQFARAVARRYGDRVDRYLIWNEPNQPGWLMPQRDCRGRGRRTVCTPRAPHQYRRLYLAAERAIRSADRGAKLFLGELAPVGDDPTNTTWRPLAPLPFLRAMGCVDNRFRPLRAGSCRNYRAPRADAFGYHPHGKQQAPDRPNPDRTEAQIADLDRLFRTLDRLTRRRRLVAPAATGRRFDVYMTEFGFQTAPPDRLAGVSLEQQARYLQQSAYLLWRRPRVRNLTHYQWEDEIAKREGPKSGYGGWQSGLFFYDGRPKPAAGVFAAPFVYDRRRTQLWGQVRPGLQQQVFLQERDAGATIWKAVEQITTDASGYWTSDYPVDQRADYRFAWIEPPLLPDGKPVARTSAVLAADGRNGPLLTSAGRGT
jgi:hypothetical protein